jgi:AbrB family looped-hinge helix DNA binding protein
MPDPTIVRVSSKYQIAIPLELRRREGIRPGALFEVIAGPGGLRLVPVRPLRELRGVVRRDDTVPIRDEEDRV